MDKARQVDASRHGGIDNAIEKIDDNAFRVCADLEDFEFAVGLRSIGICSFFECTSLMKKIELNETVLH